MPVDRPRHALDQDRHLLVPVDQPPVRAVQKRLGAHRAGVHGADRRKERFEALLRRPLVRAEDAVVLPREGVAEAVLEEGTRPDDDRRLAEIFEHRDELLLKEAREGARQDPLPRHVRPVHEGVDVALAAPRPPASVADEERVEDVGADVERVVRLQPVPPARVRLAENRAGEEHPDRLPADQPRADHPLPEGEQVVEVEPPGGEGHQPLVAGDHHPEEPAEDLRRLPPGAHAEPDLVDHFPRLEELPVPDVERARGRIHAPLREVLQHLGEDRALREGAERLPVPDVGEIHRRGGTPVDLQRVDVETLLVAEDVDQQLRRAADRRDGVERVSVAQKGEVGHRVEVVQVRAGDHEEVAQHQVAVPVGREVREAVEDVEGTGPGLLDHLVDPGGERLEAHFGMKGVDLRPDPPVDELRVAGEAEVDEPFSAGDRVANERVDERAVVVDDVHLPDDVVARQDPREDPVEAGQPGAQRLRFRPCGQDATPVRIDPFLQCCVS